MSYLQSPRIHFVGRFQADTSTVNNDVRHFDDARFLGDFQKTMEVKDDEIVKYNGYWNPEGSGAWRLLGCRVTSALVAGRTFDRAEDDPAVGLVVGGSTDRVAGKLVDLDPQQQMTSQIWGLAVCLQDDRGVAAFRGQFEVAAFCDLWKRQQNDQFFDQQLGAVYQSMLIGVEWLDFADSPCLRALKERSAAGLLSIRMNVFGFQRNPVAAEYATGVVVGTIGPAEVGEARQFTVGRHFTAALTPGDAYPFVPADRVFHIQAQVDPIGRSVAVDLGNALPITDASGTLEDLGPLSFGVLRDPGVKQGDTVSSDAIELLGDISYQDAGWFFRTAGIQDFPVPAGGAAAGLIKDHPLAVVSPTGSDRYLVVNRETADGIFLRADAFVYRLNPGESACIEFHASRYGQPLSAAAVMQSTEGFMGGPGTGAKIPEIPIPKVNTPAGVIRFPAEFQTGPDGRASMTIVAAEDGPGHPRDYLDGQVYGIAYQFKNPPANYNASPFNYISILAWDRFEEPEHPTWFRDIRPIMSQYANLYPIMSKRLMDLRDYDSVIANLDIMKLSFSLPPEEPNSMPVTRDLSAAKRRTILKWLDSRDSATGRPPLGDPLPPPTPASPAAVAGAVEAVGHEPNVATKVEFLREALKYRQP